MPPAGKKKEQVKRISQATFDSAVQENVDEFEMEVEEAIADAVAQFEAQGIDLGNIVKAPRREGEELHAVQGVSERLAAAVAAGDLAAAIEHGKALIGEMAAGDEVRGLAGTFGAVPAAAGSLALALAEEGGDDAAKAAKAAKVVVVLPVLTQLLRFEGNRDLLDETMLGTVARALKEFAALPRVQECALACARNACIRNETNRQRLVERDVPELLVAALRTHGRDAGVVREGCAALRALTQDDDMRHTYGQAHENAKKLVREGGLAVVMEQLGVNLGGGPGIEPVPSITAELCSAMGRLAVRNEYCTQIVESGGMGLALGALRASSGDAAVAKQCFVVLRAVAGNDACRRDVVAEGGAELVVAGMRAHKVDVGVQEQGCAALVSMSLRNPDNCVAIVQADGVSALLAAMRMHSGALKVQRHACLALRNLVSRNPELKAGILEQGAEELIRAVRLCHPTVDDIAKAALRDLGCDVKLQELFTSVPEHMQAKADLNGPILAGGNP